MDNYKYLGTLIDIKLSSKLQIKEAKCKISRIIGKLSPYRKYGNFKFNVNCFWVYALPQIMLIPSLEENNSKGFITDLDLLIKWAFKSFISVGSSLSSSLVYDLLGFTTEQFIEWATKLGSKD